LQCAAHIESCRLWEELWDAEHPGRLGEACVGEDFALVAVWCEKVRAMITQCGQDAVFAMPPEQYTAKLIDSGAGEEEAAELAAWMSEVMHEKP
jgi:hypothetical protein